MKEQTSTSTSLPQKSRLVIIFFTVFIFLVGFGMILPFIPLLSRDLGASSIESGFLIAIYSLMQFIFSPFWGKLSDRFGRRPILLGCLLGEGFAYVLFGVARDLHWLFFARALAGFFGASIATASAYISDITPTQERSKGMAIIGAAFGLGFVIGPALGGGLTVLGQKISTEPFFSSTFATFIVAGLCFFNFLFALRFLKESLPLKNAAHVGNDNPPLHSNKGNRWNLLKRYLSVSTVGPLIILFFLSSFSMASMEATLVLYMAKLFAWTIREVSYGFAYIGIIIVITQGFLVRRLMPLIGERRMLTAGVIFLLAGFAGLAFVNSVNGIAFSLTLVALGNGLGNPSTLGSISLLTNSSEQGAAMGVAQSMSALGRIIGPAIGGVLFERYSLTSPFLFSTGIAAIALGIVMSIFYKIPEGGMRKVI